MRKIIMILALGISLVGNGLAVSSSFDKKKSQQHIPSIKATTYSVQGKKGNQWNYSRKDGLTWTASESDGFSVSMSGDKVKGFGKKIIKDEFIHENYPGKNLMKKKIGK